MVVVTSIMYPDGKVCYIQATSIIWKKSFAQTLYTYCRTAVVCVCVCERVLCIIIKMYMFLLQTQTLIKPWRRFYNVLWHLHLTVSNSRYHLYKTENLFVQSNRNRSNFNTALDWRFCIINVTSRYNVSCLQDEYTCIIVHVTYKNYTTNSKKHCYKALIVMQNTPYVIMIMHE